MDDFEDRVCNQTVFQSSRFKATMYNLLAYIKHHRGQNEAALECLRQAEELIQREHTDQAEIRSVVTWGNYAWVYYDMGRLSEAQVYVDKVKHVCEKFSNPYSTECPELDSEEGWTLLQCGAKRKERAKVCSEKALEKKPHDPEFSSGLAIAMHGLGDKVRKQDCVGILKDAVELNAHNQYIKVLLALKLQNVNKEAKGEPLVVEALEKAPRQTDVLYNAAKFYQIKGDTDKAIELFQKALESMPNSGYICHQISRCYREKAKQIQDTGYSEVCRNREKFEELSKCAMDYSSKAMEKGLSALYVYSDLIELETECHQTAFNRELPNTERKQLHQGYHNLQEYQGTSEDTPVQHLKGLSLSTKSTEKEKMKYQPQDAAENQLPQNTPNSWYLQGLTHKLNGNLWQAAECFEKELGCLLRNSPSGISRFFLPTSELEEEGSERVDQGAESSTLGEPLDS